METSIGCGRRLPLRGFDLVESQRQVLKPWLLSLRMSEAYTMSALKASPAAHMQLVYLSQHDKPTRAGRDLDNFTASLER